MKRDIYKHEERYSNWKKKIKDTNIEGISKENSNLIKKYIFDMETGLNVAVKSVKGARSYIRLNNLKQRMIFMTKEIEQRLSVSFLGNLTEENITIFFNSMRNGQMKRKDGQVYQSVGDYVKVFKSFWHWYMKVNRKANIDIQDITIDLDARIDKPKWVYLNEEQIKKFCQNATFEYRVLITFLYDSGVRSPVELLNLKVSDFSSDFKELNIRQEIAKKGSFGRKIKLMLCSDLLKEYVKEKKLKSTDVLFDIKYDSANKYLQRLALKLFGDNLSEAGKKYSQITMYDFRHCSCCYWLPRYKSESALKYRFGWKKSDKIHYYSELLGMKDTISEEDLLVDTTKTEIEKRLNQTERENEILKDKVALMEKQMLEIQNLTDTLFNRATGRKIIRL